MSDLVRHIRLPLLLLAVLLAVCGADLAHASMVVSGDHGCVGPACDDQIACGPAAQPQLSPGSAIPVVALPAAAGQVPAPARAERRVLGPAPVRDAGPSLAPLGSRAPPAV